jgi:hypothetical protein
MLKRLAILTVVVFAAVGVSGQPNQAATGNQQKSQPKIQAVLATGSNQSADTHTGTANDDPPEWHAAIKRPEWWLVGAAFLTLFYLAKQARETRKAAEATVESAKATRDSIRLQEAGMRQWVNVVPICVAISRKLEDPCTVMLKFEIVNRTDFLVTILGTEIEVIANIHSVKTFKVDCRHPLVPQKSDRDHCYPFYVETDISMGDWSDSGRIFIVAGTIRFLDCMEIERSQLLEELYLGFADGRLERMKPAGIAPEVIDNEEQNESINPN